MSDQEDTSWQRTRRNLVGILVALALIVAIFVISISAQFVAIMGPPSFSLPNWFQTTEGDVLYGRVANEARLRAIQKVTGDTDFFHDLPGVAQVGMQTITQCNPVFDSTTGRSKLFCGAWSQRYLAWDGNFARGRDAVINALPPGCVARELDFPRSPPTTFTIDDFYTCRDFHISFRWGAGKPSPSHGLEFATSCDQGDLASVRCFDTVPVDDRLEILNSHMWVAELQVTEDFYGE